MAPSTTVAEGRPEPDIGAPPTTGRQKQFEPTPPSGRRPQRTMLTRATLLAVALFTAWHVAASFLWIGPITPLRELVPGDLLSRYMLPWLGQSWSVFAPSPINGNYEFKVRAVLADKSGQEIATEWISASGAELTMSHHNLFPPRAANLGLRQASNLKGSWDALTDAQKDITKLNYFKNDDWLGRMQIALNDVNDKQNADAVVRYIVQERYSDAYAVQVARAVWGNSVVRVQFESSRQNIIPFVDRHDASAKLPPLQSAPTGWRGVIVMPGQSEAQFAEIFRPAHEKASGK